MTHPDNAQDTIKRLFLALKDERRQRAELEAATNASIAIVGMSCRFPGGANSPEEFWKVLGQSSDAIREVPADRWSAARYLSDDRDAPSRMYTARGGFLDVALGEFDAAFFHLSPREAKALDPQQRLLLELAWEALESAGLPADGLKGSPTGVFIGICADDYALAHRHSGDLSLIDAYSLTGSTASTAAGRISYVLGLEGPAIPVDTACSSSLVSLQLACRSLQRRECKLALAGGVNLILSPDTHVCFSRLQAIARDGRCKTFDASADGYSRGEGGGMLVLKRLDDALADRDEVLAVVKASVLNQDGHSNGFTAPNGAAQRKLLRDALRDAKLQAGDIDLVETHGTGTALGDPIEAEALGEVLCAGRDPAHPLILGAVKTRIGHLEAAAGVASIIKAVLSLRHERIPSNLNFTTPSPLIDWAHLAAQVPTQEIPWPKRKNATRHVGISSFGFSGTNAHIILGEAPEPAPLSQPASPSPWLLCVSARTPAALQSTARRFHEYLAKLPDSVRLYDVCATALAHRNHFAHRIAIVGRELNDFLEALDQASRGLTPTDVWEGPLAESAAQYRQGQMPAADMLYPLGSYKRVSLPNTAFDPQPCLFGGPGTTIVPQPVPALATAAGSARFHPLIDRLWKSPLLSDILCESEIGLASHPFLGDHRVFGRVVWPAAAGLSMMMAAAARAAEGLGAGPVIELENIVFEKALLIPDYAPVHLQLLLRPQESGHFDLRLVSLAGDRATTHVTARLNANVVSPEAQVVLPAEAWEQSTEDISEHRLFHAQGDRLTLGPAFRCISSARRTQNRALAQLVSTEAAGEAAWAPSPHPGLIDAGFQLLLALAPQESEDAFVPVRIERLSFLAKPAAACAWAESILPGDAAVPSGDVSLFDAERRLLLKITGLQGQKLSASTLRRMLAESAPEASAWRIVWHRDQTGQTATTATAADWLAFLPENSPPGAFAHSVVPGSEFSKQKEGRYFIRPDRDEDYARVFEAIAAESQTPIRNIVFVPSTDEGLGFAPLAAAFRIAQAVTRQSAPPRLWFVTRMAAAVLPGEAPSPFQATLWGMGRSLAHEFPLSWGGLIDLPANFDLAGLPALLANAPVGGEMALRGTDRYHPRIEAARLPDARTAKTIRSDATYMITGGRGALGLLLAEWLADAGAKNLILLGRSTASPETDAHIERLRQAGLRLECLTADVADEGDMTQVFDTLRKPERPPLAGIFHLAGSLSDGLLSDMSLERWLAALRGKARGAWLLHRLSEGMPLDFMVLFSSATALLGAAGQTNYAAANAFLDALAQLRRQQGLPTLSIAWGPWAGDGMAADAEILRGLTTLGLTPLAPASALASLEPLLSSAAAHIGIFSIDWQRYRQNLHPAEKPELLSDLLPNPPIQNDRSMLADEFATISIEGRREMLIAFLGARIAEVLGADADIAPTQNLLELGLDSLMALKIRNSIEATIKLSLSPTLLFEYPTVAQLADQLAQLGKAPSSQVQQKSAAPISSLPPATDSGRLSAGQQGLWFLQQLFPKSAAFHTAFSARICSPLDVTALETAFRRIIERHEVLCSRFFLRDGRPVRETLPSSSFSLRHESLEKSENDALHQSIQAAYHLPFRLDEAPPLRVHLWQLGPDEHVLLIVIHHISIDVMSFDHLLQELRDAYAAIVKGEKLPASETRDSYRDFVSWQNELLAGHRGAALRSWWREQVADLPVTPPPLARFIDASPSFNGRSFHFALRAGETASLEQLRQQCGVTLNMLMLGAWMLLTARLNAQDEVCVGTPMLGRSDRRWTSTLGFFVNVVPIRASLADDPSLPVFLDRIRNAILGAITHQDLPFAEIASLAPETGGRALHPLFQTLFHLRDLSEMGEMSAFFVPERKARVAFGPLAIEPCFIDQQEGQYPLTMEWFKGDGVLSGVMKYDTAIYDAASISTLAEAYVALLAALTRQAHDSVLALNVQQPEPLAKNWSATRRDFTARPIHQLFSEQARIQPEQIALCFGDQTLSYGALNRRANRLARSLQTRGIAPEQRVGIALERSFEMVIGLLAILKCGAAYVPLSADDPTERLKSLIADADISLILISGKDQERFSFVDSMRLMQVKEESVGDGDDRDPTIEVSPDFVMYVLFTSGTTGVPKGVMVSHASVHNLVAWSQRVMPLTASDASLQKTPLGFDPSVGELFWPLCCGARVAIAQPGEHADPSALVNFIVRRKVSIIYTVPSQLHAIVDEAGFANCTSLRNIICGGETLPAELIRRFHVCLPATELINVYGPTEATVHVTAWKCPETLGNEVLLGEPIDNCRVYVLDNFLRPVPVGAKGQLYLAGICLARGYQSRPDLTAEAFVEAPENDAAANPLCPPAGERLYRSGDYAKLVRSGEGLALQFLGRDDAQVKLRGMRLELGGIEALLCRHPAVRQAVVRMLAAPSGEACLAACVVPMLGAAPDGDVLRQFVEQHLAAWMAPRFWLMLPELPCTSHGKTDFRAIDKALSERLARTGSGVGQPVLPQGELEERIAALWSDLLHLPRVGRHENFFDLGGNSLLLVRLTKALSEAGLGSVSVLSLFRHTSVASMAALLGGTAADARPPANPRSSAATHDIAVIGMAIRAPGASNLEAFKDMLMSGREGLSRFTRAELLAAGMPADFVDNPLHVPANGVLEGVEQFDAAFFGFSPREAETLDPQHRLFLETVWHALEHGGYGRRGLRERVGIFAGSEMSNYLMFNLASRLEAREMNGGYALSIGNDKDFLASRAAYTMDLHGPATTVQTACSTSLTAVVSACDALMAGHCDMALAGGVSIQLPQIQGYIYREGMVTSKDGHCRPFDAQASGTVNGNGVGVVLLKPLAAALRDGDFVHAVIKGWAINNDGSQKAGYSAPNPAAQASVLADAWSHAGIRPAELGYIEAHGTGTPLGDPIEISALAEAFGNREPDARKCLIGSVKSNVGHLGAAAGVAGLIKTVLTVRDGKIPPSLHFDTPNPAIDFAHAPFAVNTGLCDWPAEASPRIAGVSSFGIGGTNVHVVVEAPPPLVQAVPDSGDLRVLPVSAGSADGLNETLAALTQRLGDPELSLDDAAFTLQEGRSAFAWRSAVVCRSKSEAQIALKRLLGGSAKRSIDQARPVFLFPGQGSQHPDMLRGLYQTFPDFKADIDACLEQFSEIDGIEIKRLMDLLFPPAAQRDEAARFMAQTRYAQPLLFIVELSLARLWLSLGVEPQALLGHSIGEYVAASLAGVFSREDGLRLVAARGCLMQSLPTGSMLAVNLPAPKVLDLLNDEICLAGDNSPGQSVLSGPNPALKRLAEELSRKGVFCQPLVTSHAFHSGMMDPILNEFREIVARVPLKAPAIPIVSCRTGEWLTASEATDPGYWVSQLRETVRFRPGIETLVASKHELLLEVGPGRALCTQALKIATGTGTRILSSARRDAEKLDDREVFLSALAMLWSAGVDIRWEKLNGGKGRRVPMPVYPFDRQRYWIEAAAPSEQGRARPVASEATHLFQVPDWTASSLPSSQEPRVPDSGCMLFSDTVGFGSALAGLLRQAGQTCILAQIGDTFSRINDSECIVPRQPAALSSLLAKARQEGKLGRIIYCAAIGADANNLQSDVLPDLLSLAQALESDRTPLELVILGEGCACVSGNEASSPLQALLTGPALVIPQDLPWIKTRLIDIDPEDRSSAPQQVFAELGDRRGDRLVAYRRRRRWIRSFHEVEMGKAGCRLRHKGVYLVTGGQSGIGLELARFLAREYQAQLVLCSRTPIPPDDPRQMVLEEIRQTCTNLTLVNADVADVAAMRTLVDDSVKRHGVLHGVIHAAGIGGRTPIGSMTPEVMAAVFAPKVAGTLALSAATKDLDLDFLVLFSSTAALLGGSGLMPYAAANAFLDSFAERLYAEGKPYISIGWDAWAGIGLSQELKHLSQHQATQTMTVAEGIDRFHRLMSLSGFPHVAVSKTDIDGRLRSASTPAVEASSPKTRYSRPELATSFIAPSTPLQQRIAALWQETLGVSEVGIADNFFELGGDSLIGASLISGINQSLGLKLSVVQLFEMPTVESQALYLETANANGTKAAEDNSDNEEGQRAQFQARRSLRRQKKQSENDDDAT